MLNQWKRWMIFTAACLVPLGAAWAQLGSAARFTVPFAFEVSGMTMPSGQYDLQAGSNKLAQFAGVQHKGAVLTYWQTSSSLLSASDPTARLTFLKIGERYYLKSGEILGKMASWPLDEKKITLQAAQSGERVVIVASR